MKKINLAYIIDDDDILVMVVKLLMQRNPLYGDSQEFYNGEPAIEHLQKAISTNAALPDVILLDLNMPLMDGWQFLEVFVKLPFHKEIPVFIVTSSIDPADIAKAEKYKEVKGYIMKPVTQDKLNHIIAVLSESKPQD